MAQRSTLFFITPVAFPDHLLRERGFGLLCDINPFFYLIDIIRTPLIHEHFSALSLYEGASIYSIIIWIAVFLITRKMDAKVVFYL